MSQQNSLQGDELIDLNLYKRAISCLRDSLEETTRGKDRVPCAWIVRGLGIQPLDVEEVVNRNDLSQDLEYTIEVIENEEGMEVSDWEVAPVCEAIGRVLLEYGFEKHQYMIQADKADNGLFFVRVGQDVRASHIQSSSVDFV